MPSRKRKLFKALLPLLVFALTSFEPAIYSQQTDRQTPEVIRINTELVQTEVMVFDRQGRFVAGLQPDQFELLLNGVKQPVSFFEKVTAGSQAEAAQLAAARRGPAAKKEITKTEPAKTEPVTDDGRGRVLFFFLDDLHTSPASLARARKALLRFVDEQMNPNDQVAIVSASGQVGFLQQLTDNPAVLHAAIGRLNNRQVKEGYPGKTQISEYMASQIEDYKNRQLLNYLMDATKVEQQMGPGTRHGDHRPAASYSSLPFIENRVNQINIQARQTTLDTLSSLKGLMLSSAVLPGRKVLLFLSDGFLVSERKSGLLDALEGVTEAAKRSGVIVYTMDLRGTSLNMGSGVDVSSNEFADFSSRRAGLAGAEIAATQEPLKRIAEETGGRAILNSNAIGEGFLQAIGETSNYYLLAWRPESQEQREGKQRLQVSIKGRPDLRVRLRNDVYKPSASPPAAAKSKNEEPKILAGMPVAERELVRTLGSLYPEKTLPVSLSAGYLNTRESGLVLKLSMQIDRQALDVDPNSKTQPAEVDVAGVAADDRGQLVSFKQVLTVPGESSGPERMVTWHQQLLVKPGLYQVRIAVRERSSGRTGSAMQWIDLPETAAAQFSLSSLFLGERKEDSPIDGNGVAVLQAVTVDVDHRFTRNAALRFQTYVYNATRGEQGPRVSIEAQVLRNRQQILRIAPASVPVTNDAARLPYWSEIALEDLPRGQYVLLLIATDQIANRSASQRINFVVE